MAKKIVVQNVMKVIDIWHEDVTVGTRDFLEEFNNSYTDNHRDLSEDLLNAPGAFDENQDNEDVDKTILKELEILSGLCAKHDAAYVRFIKT